MLQRDESNAKSRGAKTGISLVPMNHDMLRVILVTKGHELKRGTRKRRRVGYGNEKNEGVCYADQKELSLFQRGETSQMTLQVKVTPEVVEYLLYHWNTHGGPEEEEKPRLEVRCYT
jgi:hypothetical protein